MTLLELMVTMSIMSFVTMIATVGIIQMYLSLNRVEARSTAATQVRVAMQRLDKEIRYAEGISRDGRVAGDWYVEYRLRNLRSRAIDCVGLRLTATGRLERRAWVPRVHPG